MKRQTEEMESQERAPATVRSGARSVWRTSMIPSTIRRPWRVYEEDLEDQLARVQARLEAVQGRGARAIFASLPEESQRD